MSGLCDSEKKMICFLMKKEEKILFCFKMKKIKTKNKKRKKKEKKTRKKQPIKNNENSGCTSGGVYVPCIYTHSR